MIAKAQMFGRRLASVRIDCHAADGIAHRSVNHP